MESSHAVRDSPEDLVNVTLWLHDDAAKDFDNNYRVGHVIVIQGPRVVAREPNDLKER